MYLLSTGNGQSPTVPCTHNRSVNKTDNPFPGVYTPVGLHSKETTTNSCVVSQMVLNTVKCYKEKLN